MKAKEDLANHIIRTYVKDQKQPTSTTEVVNVKQQSRIFTTEPKTRRHIKHSISGKRLRRFMRYLFSQGFFEVNYKALKLAFITFFETNDERVIEKYIGRPKTIVRSSGKSLVRLNRKSGTVAQFDYHNTRRVKPKKGLAQVLGYISMDEDGNCWIHHNLMPYFTEQTPLTNPPTRVNECQSNKVAIDNLCVCPIGKGETNRSDVGENGDREEREVIESTHKSCLDTLHRRLNKPAEMLTNVKPSVDLSAEELRILRAARGS